MSHRDDDVVITGVGAATAGAYGLAAHWQLLRDGSPRKTVDDLSMAAFKAAPYLSDKRLMKAVSAPDAIGLAALEGLVKERGFKPGLYARERVGVYVGAPPASTFDNEPYMDAMRAARGAGGRTDVGEFGRTCMSSRPTTLLIGLPNNVLCYGALILDARGPNSNYTASGVSAPMALHNAARRVRRGALDLAVAGGFSAHTEPVNRRIFQRLGVEGDAKTADGGVFVAIERRGAALARGAKVLATYASGALASDALGPATFDERGEALFACIRRALAEAGIGPESIGLVLASSTGSSRLDASELSVLSRVFANERDVPALGTSSRVLGNLGEAAGVLELGILGGLAAAGELPLPMRLPGHPAKIDAAKPYTLLTRVTPWGEYAATLARAEVPCRPEA